jgi:hypothetical protein
MTPVGAEEDCVITDEVELDRAGEDGRTLTKDAAAGGDGAVRELAESRCRWWLPFGKGDGGAKTDVGVGTGVFWAEETAVPAVALGGPSSPLYTSPSSPGKKDSVEQNPSDEEISNVEPSLDLLIRLVSCVSQRGWSNSPSQIGKCCTMQIAHDANRGVLLCIV